jgi:23S rRNA (cytidine1920-2'-O)/16S rRNA (cytidine1409-2'-O)-methyltransferase
VDVGYGQLHERLRSHPQVAVLERTNVRSLRELPFAPDLIVCDVSFISVRLALPPALALARPEWEAVVLVKPQFEAGAASVGGKGVVRDPAVHQAVCERVIDWWSGLPGWTVSGVIESPITGPEGNKEFLLGAHLLATNASSEAFRG